MVAPGRFVPAEHATYSEGLEIATGLESKDDHRATVCENEPCMDERLVAARDLLATVD